MSCTGERSHSLRRRTDILDIKHIPTVTSNPLRPLLILEQFPHLFVQMLLEWHLDLDHVLVGRVGVGVEEVVEVLDIFEGVGDDDGAAELEVSVRSANILYERAIAMICRKD